MEIDFKYGNVLRALTTNKQWLDLALRGTKNNPKQE